MFWVFVILIILASIISFLVWCAWVWFWYSERKKENFCKCANIEHKIGKCAICQKIIKPRENGLS